MIPKPPITKDKGLRGQSNVGKAKSASQDHSTAREVL